MVVVVVGVVVVDLLTVMMVSVGVAVEMALVVINT